jgi:carboxylesterase type B
MGLDAHKEGLAAVFSSSLERHLSSSAAAKAILKAYGIDDSTSDDDAMKIAVDFATDIGYYIPAFTYSQSWSGKAYRYHFNEPNPWDGPFKGYATHSFDIFYLFQNYNEKLSPEAREVAIALAKDFIGFANGKATWPEYKRELGVVRTFGPSGLSTSSVEKDNEWGHRRRDTLVKLSQEGVVDLDELSVAWDKFLAGN